MTKADQKREDDVLRRMLATKPKPHKDTPKQRDLRKLERPINESDFRPPEPKR